MNTPALTSLRMTAYHMVDASPVPLMRNHGRGGGVAWSVTPAATS